MAESARFPLTDSEMRVCGNIMTHVESMFQRHFSLLSSQLTEHYDRKLREEVSKIQGEVADVISVRVVAAVKQEVSLMLDSASSHHSQSTLESSITSTASNLSLGTANTRPLLHATGGAAAGPAVEKCVAVDEVWPCPICCYPLKNEKCFHDHITLLHGRRYQSPVAAPPNGKSVRRRRKEKCLMDASNAVHVEFLRPWQAFKSMPFWDKCGHFLTALLDRLNPGAARVNITPNPHLPIVVEFLRTCRSGEYVAEAPSD
jgi:hypothetical protein